MFTSLKNISTRSKTLLACYWLKQCKNYIKLLYPHLDKFFLFQNTKKIFIASCYRQLSAEIKMKNYKIKTSFVKARNERPGLTKLVFMLGFYFNICDVYAMLYIIFKDGWEQIQIQRIIIGLEAILEKKALRCKTWGIIRC